MAEPFTIVDEPGVVSTIERIPERELRGRRASSRPRVVAFFLVAVASSSRLQPRALFTSSANPAVSLVFLHPSTLSCV